MDVRPNDAAIASAISGAPSCSAPLGALCDTQYASLQRDVDEIKAVMCENVEVMLAPANSEKARVVEGKAEEMVVNARSFRRVAHTAKRRACLRLARVNCLIASLVVFAILIALLPWLSWPFSSSSKPPPPPPPPPPRS